MHGEDLLVDYGSNGKAIEAVCKCLPKFDIVSAFALVIKAVDAVYASTLMVSPQDEEVLRVFDLVGQQQADRLKGLLAAVNVVA